MKKGAGTHEHALKHEISKGERKQTKDAFETAMNEIENDPGFENDEEGDSDEGELAAGKNGSE
jgi:hypothetical protein